MSYVYLLSYSDDLGTREEIKNHIESISEISHWRYDMPNSFYLVSELSADELAKKIREKAAKGRFIIAEITGNSSGWLTTKSWHLIQKKTYHPS